MTDEHVHSMVEKLWNNKIFHNAHPMFVARIAKSTITLYGGDPRLYDEKSRICILSYVIYDDFKNILNLEQIDGQQKHHHLYDMNNVFIMLFVNNNYYTTSTSINTIKTLFNSDIGVTFKVCGKMHDQLWNGFI